MPFNGAGTYTLPGAALANGGVVDAPEHNTFRNDVATALTDCVTRDGQSPATANIPMGGFKITGLAAGTTSGDAIRYEQLASAVQAQSETYFTTGGTSTAYTLTPSPALSALAAGQRFRVIFHTAPGATPTLAISSLTAKNLKFYDGAATKQAITSADVPTGWVSDVEYDGTDYVVLSPASRVISGGAQTIAGVKTFTSPVGVAAAAAAGDAVRASQVVVNSITPASMVRLNTFNGYGSTNTAIGRFTNVVTNQGADITYADSATLGATFTINTPGTYSISWCASFAGANDFGFSLNSTQLTTAMASVTISDVIAASATTAANIPACVSSDIYLQAGSIVRPHGTVGGSAGTDRTYFTITRVN